MRRWRGIDATGQGWGRSVVTIGVFDGVHIGHQRVIGAVVSEARTRGEASVVVTFDPHPAEVVRPGTHPPMLTGVERKAELVEALGVDGLCVIPFTREFSQLAPERFAHDVLVERLHASLVVVGENFRFGHRAAGDVTTLTEIGRRFGFAVRPATLVRAETPGEDVVYSSTYIRSCVAAGDVASAARALGRAHRVEGVVVRGDQRGRELGYPTANLETGPYTAVPADGVYAGRAVWGGRSVAAAVSIGTNPTFAGTRRRVEAYLLDFDGELYGQHMALDFVARLRPTERFDSVGALVERIGVDVADTRRVLNGSSW